MNWKKRYKRAISRNIQLIGDKTIRQALKDTYYKNPYLEEVRFPRFTADLIYINPAKMLLAGVEIKSDRDTLDRLENQLRGYLQYFHKVWVVTTLGMKKDVLDVLKADEFRNVGLLVYVYSLEGKGFREIRKASINDVSGVGSSWISSTHQLQQWKYLLEMIWG